MSNRLPDIPRVDRDRFVESLDDSTCPVCGYDVDDERQDPHSAYHKGILLAVEKMDGSPFQAMGGAEATCYYWHCPATITQTLDVEDALSMGDLAAAGQPNGQPCGTYFTTEEETTITGRMA